MSRQYMLSRFHKNTIYIILSVLGSLLMSLQLVLPATASVASPRATSNYTFGNSRPMDLASVAVVRLVVFTSPTGVGKLPQPCSSGVGVIVSSNTSPTQHNNILNYVLTDGSLLTCGTTPVAVAITIYANNAYTNSSSGLSLANIVCASDLTTCATTSSPPSVGQPATICQNSSCSTGAILLPFLTPYPQPYLTTTLTPATPTFHITLGNPSAPVLPTTASNPPDLLPVAVNPPVNQQGNNPSATPTTQFYEPGTPLVDNNGNLVGIHTSTGDTIMPSAKIPVSTANTLQSSWKTDVADFYSRNYAAVSRNAASIETVNPNFLAATGLKTAADNKLAQTNQPNNNIPASQSNNRLFGIPLTWLLAIAGLILLILVLGLVSLIVVRNRIGVAQFERDRTAARRAATLDAERIRMEGVARRAMEEQKHQQQQPVVLPLPNKVSPAKNTIAIDPDSQRTPEIQCPNCHQLVRADASFCPNCRFSLKPVQEEHVVKMPPPVVEQSVQKIMPAPLIPAQPPREEKREQKQDNGLSIEKRAGNDGPPKVIEVPIQEAVPGDEKENSRVGQQFGNYKLLRSLGEGGFAEVYLGEHIHLGSYAAIKLLSGRLTGKEQEKFRLEARTLVRLVHPHIVRLLEFGIEDKVPFLVMDYAANGTLRQRHPRGSRLPLPLVVNYVKQAAGALQFAHDLKFIHRDIKPENMLVGSRNEILLSDFGIAIVAQSSRYQNPQDMAGTVTYMAPEQIQLHPRPASDQYALGVVTYEWLCGSRPFQGSFTEIAVKHATVPPPPLRQKVSTISLPVEQVVLKSLAKDPKDRFESVEKFAIALEQASLS